VKVRVESVGHHLGLGHKSTVPMPSLSTGATVTQLCSLEMIYRRPLMSTKVKASSYLEVYLTCRSS